MMNTGVVIDRRYMDHDMGAWHVESPARIEVLERMLTENPPIPYLPIGPRVATDDELAYVHERGYIDLIRSTAGQTVPMDGDTVAGPKTWETALLAAGGFLESADRVMDGTVRNALALVRPPGHHAEYSQAKGFCLFNNVALGARYLQERYGMKKVMIIDIDLHHGNGIQNAFYDTDQVLYASMHHFPSYPGTGKFGEVGAGKGEGFTVNIPLGKGQGDEEFARIVYFVLNPIAQALQPEFILIACGFDLYEHDRLGAMRVTPGGYGLITFFLLAIAEKVCQGRIGFIMEGGYSLRGIRECGLRVLQELCGVSSVDGKKLDKIVGSSPRKVPAMSKVMEVHSKYWPVFNRE